jgi:excisionase family DNA binding protein
MKLKGSDKRATLKVREVAEIMGCGERVVRDLIADKTIAALWLGRNVVVPKNSFLKWLDAGGGTGKVA